MEFLCYHYPYEELLSLTIYKIAHLHFVSIWEYNKVYG